MMTLIAAALAAAAPAAPAQPAEMLAHHQGQPAEHKDCCKDGCECCTGMAKHEGHAGEHGDHAQ